jgi:hypothetical protein
VPRCARCGNEEDLAQWDNGVLYCKPCTSCAHVDVYSVNGVCTICLRKAYTIWTFEGPRIKNLDRYRRDALADYSLRAFEILFWTFDEQELSIQDAGVEPMLRKSMARKPPPHHRF